jgi:hypothetical protein
VTIFTDKAFLEHGRHKMKRMSQSSLIAAIGVIFIVVGVAIFAGGSTSIFGTAVNSTVQANAANNGSPLIGIALIGIGVAVALFGVLRNRAKSES